MGPETHSPSSVSTTCQNCKQKFVIEPEDFDFYKKIDVPPPTFCPDCRFQRRLAFVNYTSLYKRKCDLCKKESISLYHPDAPYTVYCPKCWWSDDWDPSGYGRDYDFSRPFFEQLNELWHSVPLLALSLDSETLQTSPFCNHLGHSKNDYLIFSGDSDEECAYGFYVDKCKSVLDSTAIVQSELNYDCMHSFRINRCIGSRDQLALSMDCFFCRDCENIQNCFGCANLYNKKYHIFNKPYTKEAYFEELKKYDLGSYIGYRKAQAEAEAFWKTQPVKSEYNEFVENCTGPNIFFSKNVKDSIEVVSKAEDSRWLFLMTAGPIKDCYDISTFGSNLAESYEATVAGYDSSRVLFSDESGIGLSYAEYCKLCFGGNHNFGCVSVKKGKYYILNKAYGEKEYKELREKIIAHMDEMPYRDRRGNLYRYGEFLPPDISPFAYNETVVHNFFPLAESEAEKVGYAWRPVEAIEHSTTMTVDQLPDHIRDVPDSITGEVIKCPTCPRGFRIIKMELDILRRMNVPLPRRCPFCRMEEKMNIWVHTNRRIPRDCSSCGINFESKYEKSEAVDVLCKKCYYAEMK